MYGCESWILMKAEWWKTDAFELFVKEDSLEKSLLSHRSLTVLEKTLDSSLDSKEVQPVHPKGDQSWIFIGRTDADSESSIL